MYILKNSLKNLIRNKGRNALLLVIMIAILSSTAVAIIINTTSNGIIQDYKNRFGSEVFIQPNQKKSDELIKEGKMEELYKGTPNDIKEKIAESKYLKETIFTAGYTGYSEKLKSLDQEDKKNSGFSSMGFSAIGGERSKDAKDPNLNILGGLSKSGAEEFKDGTRKIKEGKMPEKSGDTIISEDFAKLNKLKIGDKFKVKNPENPNKVEPLELTVSGIYEDNTKANDMGIKHLMLNRKNEVITTYNTLKEYNEKVKKDKDIIEIDAKYFLNNPDDVEAFNKEAHEKG
ncbi:ABC transporter permease, partial [Clostridium chrysemydis]|uniref:ABC transporter permease n=1 Tax=Clostridium chrysemydis TaxID=2665504 RepID=UPI003F3E529E